MRKIIDEVYMTINGENDKEWFIQYSSQIYKEKYGYFKQDKLFNDNEKLMYKVGAAHYMIIFDENGQTGTFIALLKDELFEDGKENEYKEEIEGYRNRVLSEKVLVETDRLITKNGVLV